MPVIAKTPKPPYYAVIFTSRRTEGDNGYAAIAAEVVKAASSQEGFLGAESVRDAAGIGITVSYWTSLAAIKKFKEEALHAKAQGRAKEWYLTFGLRVCKVERDMFM